MSSPRVWRGRSEEEENLVGQLLELCTSLTNSSAGRTQRSAALTEKLYSSSEGGAGSDMREPSS